MSRFIVLGPDPFAGAVEGRPVDLEGLARRPAARIVDNAFHVLGLSPRAPWRVVDRTAKALLAALEAGDAAATSYGTPLGPRPRTAAAIRWARARLRDPDERIQHEIWWQAPARGAAPTPDDAQADAWPQAPAAWGWRQR